MAARFGGLLAAVAMLPVLASPGMVPDVNFEIAGGIPADEGTDRDDAPYPPAKFLLDPIRSRRSIAARPTLRQIRDPGSLGPASTLDADGHLLRLAHPPRRLVPLDG